MEGGQDLLQYGTCVDPLWDPFSTDHVKALVRKEPAPPNTDGSVSRNSTPLTPQEFDLLSDSNPFKQDIAEKYGLAYPGITTKSQSHDFLNKAKSLLDSDDLFRARCRRRSTNDADGYDSQGSHGGYMARRHFRESSTRAVVGLNEFLFRNQQSIEESIQRLCDSDVDLTRVKRDEFLLRNQQSIEQSIQRLESFEKERRSLIELAASDKKESQQLLDNRDKVNVPRPHAEPNNNVADSQFNYNLMSFEEKLCTPDTKPVKENGHQIDSIGSIKQESDNVKTTVKEDSLQNVDRDTILTAVPLEDISLKRMQAKSLSEAQFSHAKDDSLDIPQLFTRSIDVGDLSNPSKEKSCQHSEISVVKTEEARLEKIKQLKEGLQRLYSSSSEIVTNTSPTSSKEDKDDLSLDEAVSAVTRESIDYHFGSSLESPEENSQSSVDSVRSPGALGLGGTEINKVVRVQNSCESDSQRLSTSSQIIIKSSSVLSSPDPGNDSVFGDSTQETIRELKMDDLKRDGPKDSTGENENETAQQEMLTKEGSERATGRDQFSSSFYTVFSTTVSSLEDGETGLQDQGSEKGAIHDANIHAAKEEIAKNKTEDEDDAKWGESEDVGFSGQEDLTFHFDETSGDDSVFDETRSQHCQEELISFVDSIQSSDRGDHSPCISKDILFQTKVSMSDGDSSMGSISRESMKVNLSQDSSTLEQSEDILTARSLTPSQVRPHDVTVSLLPLAECISADSMLVNTSNESLLAPCAAKSGENSARPEESSNRRSLSIDLRRRNMRDQTRRRSLPIVRLINLGKAQPLLWTSQSVDGNIEGSHRRASLPLDAPVTREITTFKSSPTKMQYEDTSRSSLSSFGKQTRALETNSKALEAIASKQADEPDKRSNAGHDPWGSPLVLGSGSDNAGSGLPWSSDNWGIVKQFSDDFSLDHVPTMLNKAESNNVEIESTTNLTITDVVTTGRLLDIDIDKSDSSKEVVSQGASFSDHSITFSAFVKSKVQKPLRAVLPFSHHAPIIKNEETNDEDNRDNIVSQTKETEDDVPKESAMETWASPEPSEEDKSNAVDDLLGVNDAPPDLVPNDTQAEESASPKKYDAVENCIADRHEEIIALNEIDKVTIEEEKAELDLLSEIDVTVEKKLSFEDVTDKPDSSSDSDGGDIDSLVHEYKQEVVDSDEGDIDDIVKEFKVVLPETQKISDPDAEKQRKSAFNKFGRVLNKMQSVTKYMTSKKKDKEGEDKFKSPPTSGRHTRSQSEDEGADESDRKLENEDAFELLNKAAEVFKEQTVRKKRKTHTGSWRSQTVYTETLEPDTGKDYDLVTRAAILFKGFKSKKVKEADSEERKSETEERCQDGAESNLVVEPTEDVGSVFSEDLKCVDLLDEKADNVANEDSPTKEIDHGDETMQEQSECDKLTDHDMINSARVSSAMNDSGFESDIKFASEQQELTEEEVATFDSTNAVTATEVLIDISGHLASKQDIIDFILDLNTCSADKGTDLDESVDKTESFLPADDAVGPVVDDGTKEQSVTEETVKTLETKTIEMESLQIGMEGIQIGMEGKQIVALDSDGVVDEEGVVDKSEKIEEFSERSLTVDSELEPESPKILGVLNKQTCDLILSTGYDDGKVSKKSEVKISSSKLSGKESNGKLEELAKEIGIVEAAGLKFASSKSPQGCLDLRPPEFKRLSSESADNQDTNSLTVNCPDSPENGMSINGDGGFSLCCGKNIKLNCTAMVKKPERRPSAVVIVNKRCAMTEEENMFPMKVSESFKQGLNQSVVKTEAKSVIRPQVPVRIVHDLKVNEHELNRNFAGSREELLNEVESKNALLKDAVVLDPMGQLETKANDKSSVLTDTESDRKKRLEKRRSLIENPEAAKEAINMYDSVLDELVKRQESNVDVGERKTDEDAEETIKSKRYGRVMSESDFDANFGQAIEKCERKLLQMTKHEIDGVPVSEGVITDPTQYVQDHLVTIRSRDDLPGFNMQQSIDVYDNLLYPDSVQSTLDRSYRYRHARDRRVDVVDPRSSLTSVVSDNVTAQYIHGRRSHGKSTWVSSTPHLSTIEKQTDVIVNGRTNSLPYLDRPDTIPRHYRTDVAASAISFSSYSGGWGNYARIEDVNDRRSYDSESSTSGLVIPGAGRESTLSDVSDGYIFGEYSTVKDEIPFDRVIRPMDGQRHVENTFRFRNFQATAEDSPYENIKVITSQPVRSRAVYMRPGTDLRGDQTEGFEHYAIIMNPMESKYVQYSDPASPAGVIKISCASQTSTESLVGLVRDDASDILEGLPVFEYTLGATQSTESHLADLANSPISGQKYADDKPDLTRQTQSLDRRRTKHDGQRNTYVTKKATKVTFSRDAVLTDVIDGIKKSEQGSDRRELRSIASSTMSSIGGGVKEIARILNVPFQCCRSGRKEKTRQKVCIASCDQCWSSSFFQ